MIEKLGGRKTILGVLVIGAAIALELLAPKGLTETMSTFLIATAGGYFFANVGVKVAGNMKAKAVEAPALDLAPFEEAYDSISDKIEGLEGDISAIKEALESQPEAGGGDNSVLEKKVDGVQKSVVALGATIGHVAQGTATIVAAVNNSRQGGQK
jgi:hypothetical protein